MPFTGVESSRLAVRGFFGLRWRPAMTRYDLPALRAIYERPFFDLIAQARETYRAHWPEHEVQLCTLLSIKTGGCSEDCAYCSQSAHYDTGLEKETLLPL